MGALEDEDGPRLPEGGRRGELLLRVQALPVVPRPDLPARRAGGEAECASARAHGLCARLGSLCDLGNGRKVIGRFIADDYVVRIQEKALKSQGAISEGKPRPLIGTTLKHFLFF